jgi:hypothetical protein
VADLPEQQQLQMQWQSRVAKNMTDDCPSHGPARSQQALLPCRQLLLLLLLGHPDTRLLRKRPLISA